MPGAVVDAHKEARFGRAYCYRCMRAQSMCLCAELQACDNRTRVHVLQHRREKQHAFNTVRLLRLGLANLQIHEMPTDRGLGFARPQGFPRGASAGVLYPGPQSTDLATLPSHARPQSLVVIDGTWDQAHRMYRDNPWLRELRQYRLEPSAPSRYRIRKEPRAECLSTLESTVMALSLLEPEIAGLDCLSKAFDQMNDRQVECIRNNTAGPRRMKRRRAKEMRAVPRALWAEPERVVLVYGESALPFVHRHRQGRELAQWTALRLTEPERSFSQIVATASPMPCGQFLADLQWTAEDLASACPMDQVLARWHQFVGPGDCVVAWNKSTVAMGRTHGLIGEGLVLKSIYGNTTNRQFGTLNQVIEHDGLQPIAPPPVSGRAASRLANAHAAALALGRWARAQQGL